MIWSAIISLETYFDQTDENIAKDVRARRDVLLAQCDWTQVGDAPVDRDAWAGYRQQLRDLPADPSWPKVTFPDPPS